MRVTATSNGPGPAPGLASIAGPAPPRAPLARLGSDAVAVNPRLS